MKDWRTIPYWDIVKQSWQIIHTNRYLWWLGFFMALPAVFNFDYSFRPESQDGWSGLLSKGGFDLGEFIASQGGEFWIIVAIVSLLVLAFFVVLSFTARGGLIDLVFDIRKGKKGSFTEGLRRGRVHLQKLLMLGFSITFLTILAISLILIPVIILFVMKSYTVAIFLLFCALAIIVPAMFITFFLKKYGYIYSVSSRLSIGSSLESAYNLLLLNWKSSFIMLILFIPLNMFLFLAFLSFGAVLGLIFFIIGVSVWFLAGKAGIIVVTVIGLLILLIGLAILKSIFEAFSQTFWTLFFAHIASIEETEVVPVAAIQEGKKEIRAATAPAPTLSQSKE